MLSDITDRLIWAISDTGLLLYLNDFDKNNFL